MKAASPALIALLDSNQFIWADLYTFTLSDNTILRFTGADSDLVVDGNLFSSAGPHLQRGTTKCQIGVEVDQLQITFFVNSTVELAGVPLTQFTRNGGFDGARVLLERVFMATWGDTSAGTLINFGGRIADITVSRTKVEMSVNSDLELLNIQMPRNIYQVGCVNSLYDEACTLDPALFISAGNTGGGSSSVLITCNLSQANGYFELGTMTYTTGANAGASRTVKRYTVGSLVPSLPFEFAPEAGDLFFAKPGCDKKSATCSGKFSNLVNFRGYPTIPSPESTYTSALVSPVTPAQAPPGPAKLLGRAA
mgnify:CR=1 FL=1